MADILNELLGTEYTESKFRKQRQAFDKMLAANQSKFVDSAAQLEEITLQKRELERAKIAFRDERNAWQRQNYADKRAEETLEILERELKVIGNANFEVHETPIISSDKEMIVCLSDLHIGQTFASVFGEFNSSIAKERLNKYLNKVIDVAKLHNVKKVHV